MTIGTVLLAGLALFIVLLLAVTWALCAVSGRCDEDAARIEALRVRQVMRDRALAKLGGEDEAA